MLAFVKLLRKHRIALVVADTAGKWPLAEDVTADFMYLRLHGDVEIHKSYCYLDDDMKVKAPYDARQLILKVEALREHDDEHRRNRSRPGRVFHAPGL